MSWLLGCVLAVILTAPILAKSSAPSESPWLPCRAREASSGDGLRVRLTVKASDSAVLADTIRRIVGDTWKQAGLHIIWLPDNGADVQWDGLDAWILVAQAPLVTLNASVLGAVAFREDAGPSRLIRVSIDAVVAWVSRDQRARFHRFSGPLTPTLANTSSLVPRALGYAAAHELGHFILASKDHARSGLMRAELTRASELLEPESFVLDPENKQRLSSRIGELTECRSSVASSPK